MMFLYLAGIALTTRFPGFNGFGTSCIESMPILREIDQTKVDTEVNVEVHLYYSTVNIVSGFGNALARGGHVG
jgi:hypothetical protein